MNNDLLYKSIVKAIAKDVESRFKVIELKNKDKKMNAEQAWFGIIKQALAIKSNGDRCFSCSCENMLCQGDLC